LRVAALQGVAGLLQYALPCIKMCCLSLQRTQILSSMDMSSSLILLSAKQKSAVNSQFSHYKMCKQKYSTVTIYLKIPTKLTQQPHQVQEI
jgi:hypothetical protein